MRHVLVCLLLMIFLTPAAHPSGSGSNPYDLSKILFPETRTWQAVDSLPRPDMKMILRDRWLLRSIYLKTRGNALTEEPECSFITRALYEHLDEGLLRSVDMDGDGIADVAYFGSGECVEDHVAVVWFGGPDGLAERNVAILAGWVLRIETTESRRICGVSLGCCDDVVDYYFLGSLSNPRGLADVRVHKALDLPTGMTIAHEPYVVRRKTIMRLGPLERDEYHPEIEYAGSRTVKGNIIATYLPHATGTILAYFKDDKGRRWGLLEFDKDSRALRSDVTYDVDVGWIRLD